jgi:hypothetical protein
MDNEKIEDNIYIKETRDLVLSIKEKQTKMMTIMKKTLIILLEI